MKQRLDDTAIPYLYISGNHDWHAEGLSGSSEALREEWRSKVLLPLYGGRDPACWAESVGGVRFIAIDNSTYQISARQLEFFEAELALAADAGEPVVLLVHIPLYIAAIGNHGCGWPGWGAAADKGYITEQRERWAARNNAETDVFVAAVEKAAGIVAVLAGHIHTAKADPCGPVARQYVTAAGCDGGQRRIDFVPLVCSSSKL